MIAIQFLEEILLFQLLVYLCKVLERITVKHFPLLFYISLRKIELYKSYKKSI